MAEPPDEKFKLPLTGLIALVLAAVSSLIIYQVPLKTSRPIDKEAEKYLSVKADRVQARLWQDPFEAVSTHQLKEVSSKPVGGTHAHSHHTFSDLLRAIRLEPAVSGFRMLPVFMDGSPYANGVESRLKERYAVGSALGAAGYLPESGEYIRYVEWPRSADSPLLIPAEWFLPDSNSRISSGRQPVLVLWLKEQDFSPDPLAILGGLITYLNDRPGQGGASYRVLGPRTSGTLAAMLSELTRPSSDLSALKGATFYSSWATAAIPFLFDEPRKAADEQDVAGAFTQRGLSFVRTIGTDDELAEQLVQELKRRRVDLTIARAEAGDCSKDLKDGTADPTAVSHEKDTCQVPHVALISEWDTLYGRALPLTFVAVAESMARASDAPEGRRFEPELNRLRAGAWPTWVHRYSYLAGLDGELPPKADGKDGAGSQGKGTPGDQILGFPRSAGETPTGRSQLDYVRRLAETLKHEGRAFEAIGVLGSDVYDKLMILQALRDDFPRAILFTTDLDARVTHSGQGQWTRNLIIASHFGLELHPDLQTPIPPFRDSYQTALFYSALQAVDYLRTDPANEQVRSASTAKTYSTADKPRLYEVGRHGAVDLSLVQPGVRGIHAPRPDLDVVRGTQRLPETRTIGLVLLALGAALLCALLLNSEFLEILRNRHRWDKLLFMVAFLGTMAGLFLWAMRDGAGGEPFSLMDGVSVWPTTFIRLVALFLCGAFLYDASMRLRENDRALALRFGLPSWKPRPVIPCSPLGIHYWRPHPGGGLPAADLWQEYQALGRWKQRLYRILPQTVSYAILGFILTTLFDVPTLPCRGAACFDINRLVLLLSVVGMILLIFYVVDATRLCRRLIKIMIATRLAWPEDLLAREAVHHGVGRTVLNEWVGIEFIAQRTAVISGMLYYPVVVLFLMIIARHTYFDRWDFPISLVVIFGLNAAYALGNAVYLRRSAEAAKRMALAQLRAGLTGLPEGSASVIQIGRMADLIARNREGAFLPFTQHPIFGAIALPTGGTGLVLLIEYLATIR